MIKTLKKFDNMTLYEMMDHFEEGSANWTRLDKSVKFRAKLGLDHMTNIEYLEYCSKNREFMREELKKVLGKAFHSDRTTGYKNYPKTLMW